MSPVAVEWMWHPHIPLGKITLLAGQMGQAKSLFTVRLAADVTRGHGTDLKAPGSVVMLSAEDDLADVIVPRLIAADANLERVEIPAVTKLDCDVLRKTCEELGDVRLLTIDPISAYLDASVNPWKSQHVRAAMEPLRQLASDLTLAVVIVQHLNRRSDTTDPLARISDSQGLPQLARSVLIWGPDPNDPDGGDGSRKVLTRPKGNLARSRASASFVIDVREVESGIRATFLVRGADGHVLAEDVVADSAARSAVAAANDLLVSALSDGPRPAREVKALARAEGISEVTLNRAKRSAGVESTQSRGHGGKVEGWVWVLPTKKPLAHVDHLDHVDHQVIKEINKITIPGPRAPRPPGEGEPAAREATS